MEKKEIKDLKKLIRKSINEKTDALIFAAVEKGKESPLVIKGNSIDMMAILFAIISQLEENHRKAFIKALVDFEKIDEIFSTNEETSEEEKGEVENE